MTVNRGPGAERQRRGGRGLSLALIIEQAWKIVDEQGIAKLSTRTLAAALDVQSPALYWYVKSKDELLSLMIEHLLQDSLRAEAAGMDWREWLRHIGRQQRELLLGHRDSAIIATTALPSEKLRTELFPRMFEPLIANGLTARQASSAVGALASLVIGWVLYEQRTETRQFVEAFHPSGEGFEFALDALVAGIAAKVA